MPSLPTFAASDSVPGRLIASDRACGRRRAAPLAGTRLAATVALCALATAVAGCSGDRGADNGATAVSGDPAAALPRPQPGSTSVTGMPGPRSGGMAIDIGVMLATDAAPITGGETGGMPPTIADSGAVPMLEDNPETGLAASGVLDGTVPTAAETAAGLADAVARVTAYYAAIDHGDLVTAYALWGDGSTQTSVGLYVLRATADGSDWRIVDARLRPLQP